MSSVLTDVPAFTGELARDSRLLAEHAEAGEAALRRLPPTPARDAAQAHTAADVHRHCRSARRRFLEMHVAAVYDAVTGDDEDHRPLTVLALEVADRFPGLVPDATRLAEERGRRQADKEGREIDQGLLFQALLAHDRTGTHLMRTLLRPTAAARRLLDDLQRTARTVLPTVTLERRDGVAHLTVHNLDCLNAEDDQLAEDMETAIDLALLDPTVRVGVLRGAPMTHPAYHGRRVFSAGLNLRHLQAGRISFAGFLMRRELGYVNKLIRGLHTGDATPREIPWIAAVDTFAIGGGTQLLLAVDWVVIAADAYLSLPAAQEGIVPGVAGLRLGRRVGGGVARQILLTGRKLWAGEPDCALLCDEVADPRDMDRAVAAAADRLDNPAVVANRAMLNLAEEPPDVFRRFVAEFAWRQVLRLYSADVLAKADGAWSRSARTAA
ncbi:enoyl-CoA hydratase/isomerase family protein [Micromonospora sp. Llam7]|uniref:(3,5-dihydroxyphenyl)acetyl-CoA 1,2-dioxygenase DpgC n=1 Tax=Micromonospora tarapacensis TaxID=2835305 RepID=UPI001C83B190|nr:(3,5-dihydroxyphenyl)acetyl-CoA 1,2-dioxygenase DpgC [Micromonospora tarapacensis]MBX7268160.1 enoyl-CoA hydratase/isomerase family protein [Micromonospora tarapacensis]